jgi:competence protein ComEA
MKLRGPLAWFAFFKSEHTGAALLLFIAFGLAAIPRIYDSYKIPTKPNLQYDTAAVSRLLEIEEHYKDSIFGRGKAYKKSFYWGSKKQLISMGFSETAAERIENARKRGKKFESIADLAKETGMDSIQLSKIVHPNYFQPKKDYAKKNSGLIIELNNTDTNELQSLPGIGSKTALRIINYRNKLGGFYSKEQLMEIWFIDTVKIRSQFSQFTVDPNSVRRLKVNELPEIQLSQHPYLSKVQSKIIIAYTKQNGPLTEAKFLQMKGFTKKESLRLIPYLDFD